MSFGVAMVLLLISIGIFVYLSIRMADKAKNKKRSRELMTLFIVLSALLSILAVIATIRHYKLKLHY
jgi:Na+/H+ antiporter NhaD/arsenite permease-like protein